jgi:hypothetical protein
LQILLPETDGAHSAGFAFEQCRVSLPPNRLLSAGSYDNDFFACPLQSAARSRSDNKPAEDDVCVDFQDGFVISKSS